VDFWSIFEKNMILSNSIEEEIEAILNTYEETAFNEHSQEFIPYKEHCVRLGIATIELLQKIEYIEEENTVRLIAIAAAFHEISIWTHGIWDLSSSWEEAEGFMRKSKFNLIEFNTVKAMILKHKNVDEVKGSSVVEAFRIAARNENCSERFVEVFNLVGQLLWTLIRHLLR
jgi:hypothetical protein